MGKRYFHINQFHGGVNSVSDKRDIGPTEVAKGQGISVDKPGMIKTAGGIVTHGEVPTNTGVLCPASGLKVYSSDHWRETSPTAIDLIATDAATDSAVSDLYGEVEDVGSWGNEANLVLTTPADTDGGAIASSGSNWIMKATLSNVLGVFKVIGIPVVQGQQYAASFSFYNKDATLVVAYIRNDADSANLAVTPFHLAASWSTYPIEFIADGTTVDIQVWVTGSIGEIIYMDAVHITKTPLADILGDWLALADVPNAQVDLYNDNDDSFSAAALDFGTVSTYNVGGAADIINFPSTSTITDSTSQFLNNGFAPGQVWKIAGCTTETANNILIMLERVIAGTLYVRGTPLTVAADEDGTVTFTKYNPTAFHFVNEALRASPAGGGIVLRPKHYSFVNRIHFGRGLSGGNEYNTWYPKDVGPVAPTDQYVETTDSDGDRDITGDVTAGAGFEIAVTDNAAAGDWPVGTWEVASSFIYDDEQESALYIPSTAQTFTTTEGSSQDIAIRGHSTGSSYDERISGARFYHRKTLSDDPWVLLADVSMKQGARATLSGNYNAWVDGSTTYVVYSDGFDSFRRNIDTYESLTGIYPSDVVETFAGASSNNKYWDASLIAGDRCFLFGPRYAAEGGNVMHFADRILYSERGRYDIFHIENYPKEVRGDADDYIAGAFFNGRLLAFKHRNLFIINIQDKNPINWYPEKTHKFRGAVRPAAIFDTPFGPAWCNEWGVWLYNGNEVVDLLKDKIDLDDWNTFWTDYTIVGYYAKADLLILMRDATGQGGSTVPETMIFNFRLGAWTTAKGMFDTSKAYTNFETDWNQDLIIGVQTNATTITIQKFTDAPTAQDSNNIDIIIKDIDFGNPYTMGELDQIGITYKSSAGQNDAIDYELNGADFDGSSPSASMALTAKTEWFTQIVNLTPVEGRTASLRIRNNQNSGTLDINDIMLRYREKRLDTA